MDNLNEVVRENVDNALEQADELLQLRCPKQPATKLRNFRKKQRNACCALAAE